MTDGERVLRDQEEACRRDAQQDEHKPQPANRQTQPWWIPRPGDDDL